MNVARWSLFLVFLLLSAAWPWDAPSATAQSEGWSISDPAGDAYEGSARDLSWDPHDTCAYTFGLGFETCDPLVPPDGIPRQGVPAPPGFDIVAIHLRETPTDLVVKLEVARLDDEMADAMPDENDGAFWAVCWGKAECAQVMGQRLNGQAGTFSYLISYGAASCGADLPFCLWPTPVRFEAGTPGRITWTIPRVLLSDGDIGAVLDNVTAHSASREREEWTTWSVTSPLRSRSGILTPRFWNVDSAGGTEDYRMQRASASHLEDVVDAERDDQVGDAQFPDADIERILFVENETSFTVALKMGRVAASSPDFNLGGFLSLTTGPTFIMSVVRDTDGIDGSLVKCGDDRCSYRVPVPGRFAYTDGSPGWINLTLDRSDLDHPPAGTRIAGAWFGTDVPNTTAVDEPAVGATISRSLVADFLAMGPVYAFQSHGAPTGEEPDRPGARGVIIRDPAHDVSSDQPAVDTASGMFDLVLAGVEGTSPTSTRVTIGVRDLSRLSVPAGSKAVAYSVAIETGLGATMIGFYRDATRGEFFCSSDTLVLPEEKQDPADAAWTKLDGVLSVARDGGNALPNSVAAPSTLTIFVPHSCFGTESPGPIPAHSLTAAIHVIPEDPVAGVPLQRIETVDEAHDESVTAFTLGTAIPIADAEPWYTRPFGIDGFWDIMGIALAVLLPLVGLLAVRRRRNILSRYMDQIDRALSAHAHETKARETALVAIRRRLNEDALGGRINHGHFLLVDARLADHLKQARVHELTAAFGDLPNRLLEKLLEILADGTITIEEARRFGALLEDSGLTKDARERIRRKLALWVADDTP